jgi:ATP-dependent DNA ligase
MGEPLMRRRDLIQEHVLPELAEPIRYSPVLEGSLKNLIQSVKLQGLEGLVAKRRNSKYEPGQRSGAWQKMRVNRGQELVIAGYTPSPKNFDALIIGYYDGPKLMYAARTRNGFTPASRADLFKKLKPLEIAECPFANLPEKKVGRWGEGLTAAKMAECRWLLCRIRHSSHRHSFIFSAVRPWPHRPPALPADSRTGTLRSQADGTSGKVGREAQA